VPHLASEFQGISNVSARKSLLPGKIWLTFNGNRVNFFIVESGVLLAYLGEQERRFHVSTCRIYAMLCFLTPRNVMYLLCGQKSGRCCKSGHWMLQTAVFGSCLMQMHTEIDIWSINYISILVPLAEQECMYMLAMACGYMQCSTFLLHVILCTARAEIVMMLQIGDIGCCKWLFPSIVRS
jgi:hypothetical protein